MQNYIQWVMSLPYYILAPIYLLIGGVIGINYRFFMARHLWKKHQSEDRPDTGNCWCKDSSSHPFISTGDFVALATWTAPITWPIHLPIALIVLTFTTYGKLLRFAHSFGQKGAIRTFAHLKEESELRKRLDEALKSYEAEKRERLRLAGLRDECEKTIGQLRNEIFQLKAKKPDDTRFDELMDKSAKLIDKVNSREPGAIEDPLRCTGCGRKLAVPFESHVCA